MIPENAKVTVSWLMVQVWRDFTKKLMFKSILREHIIVNTLKE